MNPIARLKRSSPKHLPDEGPDPDDAVRIPAMWRPLRQLVPEQGNAGHNPRTNR